MWHRFVGNRRLDAVYPLDRTVLGRLREIAVRSGFDACGDWVAKYDSSGLKVRFWLRPAGNSAFVFIGQFVRCRVIAEEVSLDRNGWEMGRTLRKHVLHVEWRTFNALRPASYIERAEYLATLEEGLPFDRSER